MAAALLPPTRAAGGGEGVRYSPHSEQTRTHYERLLRDLRRLLPPGLDGAITDVAEDVLSVVRSPNLTLPEQKVQLEGLFDTTLSFEALHELIHYGKLLTDFVAGKAGAEEEEEAAATRDSATGSRGAGMLDLEEGILRFGGSDGDSDRDDDVGGKFLSEREKTDLEQFPVDVTSPALEEDADGYGEIKGGGRSTASISFEDVSTNPTYVFDTLRRLFSAQTVEETAAQAMRVMEFLAQKAVDRLTLETQLTAFLGGYDDEEVVEWIASITESRWAIVYGALFAQGKTQREKNAVLDTMRTHAASDASVELLYQHVTGKESGNFGRGVEGEEGDRDEARWGAAPPLSAAPLRRVDVAAYAFKNERGPHTNARAVVPPGTKKAVYETHDEVILPPSAAYSGCEPLIPIEAFPEWARPMFPGVTHLNPMQSKVHSCAFESDENMLVSAPTGAGKTNVAMMAMLRVLSSVVRHDGGFALQKVKMVYIAPMKALVQEVVRTFSQRFESIGVTVAELSGDSGLTKQQLSETQLIVTTPEKWDIVTRKSIDLGVAAQLKLLLIDEVHLLHNDRGPVLEGIVARTLIQQQRSQREIRIVGLSATLPNFADVGVFLQVNKQRGLFVFDGSYRPVPLQQTYCATKRVKGTNPAAVMNLVAYDKVMHGAMSGEQALVFVHSRRDTEFTATFFAKRAVAGGRTEWLLRKGSDSENAIRDAVSEHAAELRGSLKQLLPLGLAFHHAGLSREERALVERLYLERHVRVLVSTSTLAWGVNLPANSVIIKGTRVFSGAKGDTELLSALDVLQMFGRAGRLGFGSELGRATIITSPEDLHYYLCVLNQQLPIESHLMKRLSDMLNAEVALGNIERVQEGVQWLQKTYFYVRLRRSPELYGARESQGDPLFLRHLANLVHTAADDLRQTRMVDYDVHSRRMVSTQYGRIGSHYYITAKSMSTYLQHLSNSMHDSDLFRLFAMSSEFENISVRPEEQAQLQYLLENCPVAVEDDRYTTLAKINVLLQCYISRMKLQGLPLMSEIVYVKDSAQRILRALYEICVVREFGITARRVLELYMMTARQQWSVLSPLRQVSDMLATKDFAAILHVLESRRVSWDSVQQWSEEELSERLNDERRGSLAYDCIRYVPSFALDSVAPRPLTRGMLYLDVDIVPTFTYNAQVCGDGPLELVLTVEHTNGRIVHHETILVPPTVMKNGTPISPTLVVPMAEPKPTHYFVRLSATAWLGCRTEVAVSLTNLELPKVVPPLIEATTVRTAKRADRVEGQSRDVLVALEKYRLSGPAEKVFPFAEFSQPQLDLIDSIMTGRENLFVGIPPGTGKTVIAELFAMHFLVECVLAPPLPGTPPSQAHADAAEQCSSPADDSHRQLLYLTATDSVAKRRYREWSYKFGEKLGLRVGFLSASSSALSTESRQGVSIATAHIIVATGSGVLPLLQRNPECMTAVTHIVADHVHLLRSPEGRFVEHCLARLNGQPYVVNHGKGPARLVALSYPLISSVELSQWLRVSKKRQYNYGSSYRQCQVRIEACDLLGYGARYEWSLAALLNLLCKEPYRCASSLVFVPSQREAVDVAKRVLLRCRDFVPVEEVAGVDDAALGLLLCGGVAFMHSNTSELDEITILQHLESPPAHPETGEPLSVVLVCTFDAAWRLPAAVCTKGFVCCAERPPGRPGKDGSVPDEADDSTLTNDCSATELLQMTTRVMATCVVFCRSARRWVWSRMLNDSLPLESNMRYPSDFREVLNTAVCQRQVTSMDLALRVLQSHYFLYHLRSNVHFYGVPSAADIPIFASTFVNAVAESLRELRCIRYNSHTGVLSPAQRGVAAARHNMSMETLEALAQAVAAAGGEVVSSRREAQCPSDLWRRIAESCQFELTDYQTNRAGQMMATEDISALQTIARALPDSHSVPLLDLDYTRSATKIYLLVLAHCARLFRPRSDSHGASYVQSFLPNAVLVRITADAERILPAVRRVIHAVCEVLDWKTQWLEIRTVMHFAQLVARSTWTDESLTMQLPLAQQAPKLARALDEQVVWPPGATEGADALVRIQIALQRTECSGVADEAKEATHDGEVLQLLQNALYQVPDVLQYPADSGEGLANTSVPQVAAQVLREVRGIPDVTRLSASGAVEEVDGGLAIVVTVEAAVAQAAPPSDECSGWWCACYLASAQDDAEIGPDRLLALSTIGTAARGERGANIAIPTGATEALTCRLVIPLNELDEQLDLDLVTMKAALVSMSFRVDVEVEVVFQPPPEEEESGVEG